MSWVSGWFNTTQAPNYRPEPSHASTTFSDLQSHAVEESKSYRALSAKYNTTSMEEEEEIRRPYWQVREIRTTTQA